MTVKKTLYTIGEVDAGAVIDKIKRGEFSFEYFVYLTEESILNIGTFQNTRSESGAVVLGIAPSRRLAQRLVTHIVSKALEIDSDIKSGLKIFAETR